MSIKVFRLYGDMGKRFGKVHKIDVETVAEGLRAIGIRKPGFTAYLQERHDQPFKVLRGGEAILTEQELAGPVSQAEEIKIIPMVAGANSGFITGALLWVAAAAAYMTGFWAVGDVLYTMGQAAMISGVSQLLAPSPKSAGAGLDGSKDTETWAFGSPTLTTGQGGAVPLLYGTSLIGGALISCGITAEMWQKGGFGGLCATDDGTQYGNGDSIPWAWAKDES